MTNLQKMKITYVQNALETVKHARGALPIPEWNVTEMIPAILVLKMRMANLGLEKMMVHVLVCNSNLFVTNFIKINFTFIY